MTKCVFIKLIQYSKTMNRENYKIELDIEKRLRKTKWLIPFITLFTGAVLYTLIILCLHYFNLGMYWTVIPAAFLAHAFFIIIIHDGSHKSITRTKADRVIMNLGASIMLLPFYGELFRKYHLVHHANTNLDVDPLWPSKKKNLFKRKRWLYLIFEFVPILFSLYAVFLSKKEHKSKAVKSPSVELKYIIAGTVISLALIILFQPNLWFFISTLLLLNFIAKIRHWCEHMGYEDSIESNTFWFPLGMGIGNHDTHHMIPSISWFPLMIGLYYRKKDISFFGALFGMLFRNNFKHYTFNALRKIKN